VAITGQQASDPEASARILTPERRERLAPCAGPTLIVASVLIVLHGFWLSPKLTNQQVDLLAFWMPRFHYLGSNLAHGHIPTWLPNQFGGVPFASDPQSGWLYLPVMALFSVFSPARALGLFIVLQPGLAGLGLYLFLRLEGLGRPASTVGGLTLALTMSGSVVALSLPFSGTLAWTALALAGAAGFLHATSAASRWGFFAFAEFALSQIAAAHLTDGLLIGGGVVGLYVLARSWVQVRDGERTLRTALLRGSGLFLAFPLLSAAVLLPRLALLPRTPIGRGYVAAGELANKLSGTNAEPPLYFHGIGPWWGTAFARGPGGYVGCLAILLIPTALSSRRWRGPAWAFTLAGLLGLVLNLDALVSSSKVRTFVLQHRIGELWLRAPSRFRYLLVIAFAVLAGYGLQAWLDLPGAAERRAAIRRAALWLGPPLLVFGVAPLIAGASLGSYVPLATGVLVSLPLLVMAARGVRWPALAIPVVVAVELTVVGLAAQAGALPPGASDRLETAPSSGLGHAFPKFHAPFISPSDYQTPGPIGRALIRAHADHGRYFSFAPNIAAKDPRGFLFHQDPGRWPAYENGRSILFGIDEIQGYSPVQLDRYWRLVRFVDRKGPVYYNAASFQTIDLAVLRLFGVEWVIQRSGLPSPAAMATLAAKEGSYSLWRLAPTPRASLAQAWLLVAPGGGLRAVASTPDLATLEVPGVSVPRAAVTGPKLVTSIPATYSESHPEHARVETNWTQGTTLLVVRNAWDENWSATLDGSPVAIRIADYMMQGVQVPPGHHVVELTYRDTAIGKGLIVSAFAWLLLAAAWLWARRRETRA
jgi:membrane protein YfhO